MRAQHEAHPVYIRYMLSSTHGQNIIPGVICRPQRSFTHHESFSVNGGSFDVKLKSPAQSRLGYPDALSLAMPCGSPTDSRR